MSAIDSKYNQEWFKDRAINSLKRIGANSWDYSDSLLLYISDEGSKTYEELQEEGNPYFSLVTKPEREYLAAIAKNVAKALPSNFAYIDLGPGTEHKEQFFFEELKKLNKKFVYYPVDISQHYLNLAEDHAVKQGVPTISIKSSFEELPDRLSKFKGPRFISLGLTFSNYLPAQIFPLLKDMAGNKGYIFINAQIKDRVDMKALQKIYAQDALEMCDEKLRLWKTRKGFLFLPLFIWILSGP
jgi:uncharacterized SAM-dependent methyltransferase